MDIEHPDHTGASSNPLAPWNAREEERELYCPSCHEEPEDQGAVEPGDPCENTQPEYDRAGNEIPPCEGTYTYREDD